LRGILSGTCARTREEFIAFRKPVLAKRLRFTFRDADHTDRALNRIAVRRCGRLRRITIPTAAEGHAVTKEIPTVPGIDPRRFEP
jgi:hypothetical protein